MRDTFLNPRFVLGPLSPSAYRNHLSILQKRTQMSRVSALERVRVATGFNYKRGKMRPSTREARTQGRILKSSYWSATVFRESIILKDLYSCSTLGFST